MSDLDLTYHRTPFPVAATLAVLAMLAGTVLLLVASLRLTASPTVETWSREQVVPDDPNSDDREWTWEAGRPVVCAAVLDGAADQPEEIEAALRSPRPDEDEPDGEDQLVVDDDDGYPRAVRDCDRARAERTGEALLLATTGVLLVGGGSAWRSAIRRR